MVPVAVRLSLPRACPSSLSHPLVFIPLSYLSPLPSSLVLFALAPLALAAFLEGTLVSTPTHTLQTDKRRGLTRKPQRLFYRPLKRLSARYRA